jgi:hypothetical protein
MANEKLMQPAPGQIMDVAHPGKSAPSATSKSIITKGHPLMPDPMVVSDKPSDSEGEAPADEEKSAPMTTPTKRLVIKPISDPSELKPEPVALKPTVNDAAKEAVATLTDTADRDVVAEAETATDEPIVDDTANLPEPDVTTTEPVVEDEPEPIVDSIPDSPPPDAKPAPEAKPAPVVPTAQTTPVPSSGTDAVDPTAKDAPGSDAEVAEAEEAIAKQDAALEKLVESKQYFLPINALEKRRTKRFVVLGVVLALVLAAAWADIALDAGLITIHGIKPVTHFFSN